MSVSTTGQEPTPFISLDGRSLTTEDLVALGKGHLKIKLTPEAEAGVKEARAVIEKIIKEKKVVYGINTGFGKFASTIIPNTKLKELQENLIRSHAAGVGSPLSPERTRMLLALRINILSKGHSGVSLEILHQMIEAFNASCLSLVPEKGTVGASGDLAPLSHLTLGLMGEGEMWSPETGWGDAKAVLEAHGLKPIVLGPKEGLALNNGTQLITSLGAEAVERALAIARQADIIAAFTLQVLKGTNKAFDSDIHMARPHLGQMAVAWRFSSVLDSDVFSSEITERNKPHERVQDAYTLRCCPQVHGVANDTIAFVKSILTTELNSATDNPLVFAKDDKIVSGGNFHGEYPAKALDFLAIGVHELASISERRIERLCNPSLSELPAFLVSGGGLNSGFMIAHCTAAALVSENKVLCHPSSVDSLSTSAATEDHVSMGGWSARKALQVVEHVEQVLAIELLAACQALEFHRPLKATAPLEAVYELVRSVVRPWDQDRIMFTDIEAAHKLLREEKVWEAVCPYVEQYSKKHPPPYAPGTH
ncbi:histidine ammonia-lyase-like [Megalops cyprinoides]|uniref:histidine ammonia-lyase-like n=1 Tax=Megalops cyprinoides TaxID=118141 RepID=UPI0018651AD9|nr:histidine ammonia-lyase-like [Megalops cyprinoides]